MLTRDPWVRALVIVMLFIAAVYLTGLLWQVAIQFADVILVFFLAWMISFILEPLVAGLQAYIRLPRHLSVLVSYLALLVAAFWGVLQFTPRVVSQITLLSNEIPLYAAWANSELPRLQAFFAEHGIVIASESLLSYQELVRRAETLGPQLLSNTVNIATGAANFLFQIFIILILSYYMTLDGHRISAALVATLPRAYRDDARYFLASVNRAFAGFMRGQIAQAGLSALGTAAIMSAFGLQIILLPSLASGLFMLLPFIGPFLSLALPLLVAAVARPDAVLPLALSLFVLQQIVVNVVAPRLMSSTVGLHPLLVFLAVLAGAKLAGVWGALFGVPIVAVASAMVSFYHATLEERQARLRDATSTSAGETQFAGEAMATDVFPAGAPASSGLPSTAAPAVALTSTPTRKESSFP